MAEVDLVPSLRVVLMAAPGDPATVHLLPAYLDLPCLAKPVFPHLRFDAEGPGPLLGIESRRAAR